MGIKLREILIEAACSIATYRNPNTQEAADALNELFRIAKGPLMHGEIFSLAEEGGRFHISTEYSSRGSNCSDHYFIPSSVIDATDPSKEALEWGIKTRLSSARAEYETHKRLFDGALDALNKAQAEALAAGIDPLSRAN